VRGRAAPWHSFGAAGAGTAWLVNADEMLSEVSGATGLNRRQADDVVIATLTAVSEVVPTDDLHDLFDRLPISMRQRVPLSSRTASMRPTEFVARVADLTTAADEDTERNVRVVLQVLSRAASAGVVPGSVSESETDHLAGAAAALTYCSVCATFPALIVLASVVSVLGRAAEATTAISEIIDKAVRAHQGSVPMAVPRLRRERHRHGATPRTS
jgi:uncharacterized protein (DUF2267 family)